MRLTKLEIHGFKSFADHTDMVFEPGVTAIVGPNGCGKSNVSDAVRWVLGEQRARALRGAKMEEVIFQGSSARRAVNLAEVSLHFENDDGAFDIPFREVVITRRLSRSGESDYFLNGAACRLRDIHDMTRCSAIDPTKGASCLRKRPASVSIVIVSAALSVASRKQPPTSLASTISLPKYKARFALWRVNASVPSGTKS